MTATRNFPSFFRKSVFLAILALVLATLACSLADDLVTVGEDPTATPGPGLVTVAPPPTPPVIGDDTPTPDRDPSPDPIDPTPTPFDAPILSGGPALLPAPIYFLDPSGRIQRLERDSITISQIAAEAVPIDDFDVAPDGSFLVYVVENRLVRVEPGEGMTVILAADPVGEEDFTGRFTRQIAYPRISPDGTQIAFSQGGIQIIDAMPGSVPTLIQPSDPYPEDFGEFQEGPIRFFTGADWSPTGDRLAVRFSYFPEGGDVAIYDLDQNQLVELNSDEVAPVTCCEVSWTADGATLYISSGGFVYVNPGISRVDPSTGNVVMVLPGYPDGATDLSGALNLARGAHLTGDGSLLSFVASVREVEISPYFLLQRVTGEGSAATLQPLTGQAFDLRGDILWAPDGSGVLIVDLPPGRHGVNTNGTLVWHTLDGEPLTLPVFGRSPRWGGPMEPPEISDPAGLIAQAAVDFGMPADRVEVLPLAAPGLARLWAAYTVGDPPTTHQVAIYGQEGDLWRGRASYTFDVDTLAASPDIVVPGAVGQGWLDTQSVWLVVDAFVGVHGGSFNLLRYDGENITVAASGFSGSPGAGQLADLNGDGWQEVILDQTDFYILAYATGVRLVDLRLLRLEEGALVETRLERLDEAGGGPWRSLNNRAVELAEAGLWIDAERTIDEAMRALLVSSVPEPLISWNANYIRLMAFEMQQAAVRSAYPILQHVFAGDYWPSVGIMRDYSADQIFSPDTPLIAGTVAEGYSEIVSNWILTRSNAALAVMPDNAPAYFLRAWATYLADPGSPAVRADVEQALANSPGDPLFIDSLAFLP